MRKVLKMSVVVEQTEGPKHPPSQGSNKLGPKGVQSTSSLSAIWSPRVPVWTTPRTPLRTLRLEVVHITVGPEMDLLETLHFGTIFEKSE